MRSALVVRTHCSKAGRRVARTSRDLRTRCSSLYLSPWATAGAASADSVPMALSAGQLALQNSKKEKQGYDVFVRNLLEDTKTEDLYAFFEPAGKIIRAPRLNLGRGFAWITFDSMEAVTQAVSWSGSYLGSRIVYVHPANNVSGGDGHEKIHHPALCDETVESMVAPNPGGVYVDGTFGRGGHTRAMLAAMSPEGRMHAFDMDPEAIRVGKQPTSPLAPAHSPSIEPAQPLTAARDSAQARSSWRQTRASPSTTRCSARWARRSRRRAWPQAPSRACSLTWASRRRSLTT